MEVLTIRLIDADALKLTFCHECTLWPNNCLEKDGGQCDWGSIYHIEYCAPTIDAVQVVRCGECVYLLPNGRCLQFADDSIRPSASDYCSYGERKVEGDA